MGRTGREPAPQGQGRTLTEGPGGRPPPSQEAQGSILPPQAADSRSGGAKGHPPGRVPGGSSRYTL